MYSIILSSINFGYVPFLNGVRETVFVFYTVSRLLRPHDLRLGPEVGTNLIKFKLVFKTDYSNRLKITTINNNCPYFDITHSCVF